MESRTRKIAGVSLFVMGAGFVSMLPFQSYSGARLLAGAFEAGLVGGLADWFAVTALFRHPLGIPIPHTALLPRNRDKMTNALVTMVQNNLLHKESIVNKLKEFQAAERILDFAEKGLRAASFRAGVKRVILSWLEKPADRLWDKLRPQALPFLRSQDWTGLALSMIGGKEAVQKLAQQLLDYALQKGTHWVVTEDAAKQMGRLAIQAISSLKMNGLMQFAVNAALNYFDEEQIGAAIQHTLVVKLRELSLEGHPAREKVLAYIGQEWDRLSGSEETRGQWNSRLHDLLGAWVEGEQPLRLLQVLQNKLIHKIREEALLEDHALPLLEKAALRLRQDSELMASFNKMLQDMTVQVLEKNHSRIGALVRENIEKMDNQSLISLVEDKAGKDLQWIRVNGAVCGFFLGLIFTTVRMLV